VVLQFKISLAIQKFKSHFESSNYSLKAGNKYFKKKIPSKLKIQRNYTEWGRGEESRKRLPFQKYPKLWRVFNESASALRRRRTYFMQTFLIKTGYQATTFTWRERRESKTSPTAGILLRKEGWQGEQGRRAGAGRESWGERRQRSEAKETFGAFGINHLIITPRIRTWDLSLYIFFCSTQLNLPFLWRDFTTHPPPLLTSRAPAVLLQGTPSGETETDNGSSDRVKTIRLHRVPMSHLVNHSRLSGPFQQDDAWCAIAVGMMSWCPSVPSPGRPCRKMGKCFRLGLKRRRVNKNSPLCGPRESQSSTP